MGILFSFVFAALMWVSIGLFRRFLRSWFHKERGANDMVSFAFSNFFVLYGLLLGLLAVAAYQNFTTVSDIVTKEASSLASLYRDLRGYPEPLRTRLQDELRDYTRWASSPRMSMDASTIRTQAGKARRCGRPTAAEPISTSKAE